MRAEAGHSSGKYPVVVLAVLVFELLSTRGGNFGLKGSHLLKQPWRVDMQPEILGTGGEIGGEHLTGPCSTVPAALAGDGLGALRILAVVAAHHMEVRVAQSGHVLLAHVADRGQLFDRDVRLAPAGTG